MELIGRLREKFIREAQTLFCLSHPGLVRVTDIFEENGTAYYVMDFIDGVSLRDMVKQRGALPEAEALSYIRQAAEALEYVHSHNLLHLDIKPGNIMVERDGNVKLIDFGASKYYDAVTGENTTTLLGLNTPGYAPVEQMTGGIGSFAPAIDVYALGATLYFMLTDVTPPASVSLVCGNDTLKPLPKNISPSTVEAISAAMSHRIDDRPASAHRFAEILGGKSSRKTDEAATTPVPQKENISLGLRIGFVVVVTLLLAVIYDVIFSNKSHVNDDAAEEAATEEVAMDVVDAEDATPEVAVKSYTTTPSVAEEHSGITFEKVTIGEGWMNVPSFLKYDGETQGIMHFSDGESILYLSYYPNTAMSLSTVYDNLVNKHNGSLTTYDTYDRTASKGWFVRSGKKDGHCYYSRVVMVGKSMYSASLSFPESELPMYQGLIGEFFNGFPHVK